jgi:hypothetical protein
VETPVEGRLLRKDSRYRYYGLDGAGDANIFRRENKATGESQYLVSEVMAVDSKGKQRLKWHEFRSFWGMCRVRVIFPYWVSCTHAKECF